MLAVLVVLLTTQSLARELTYRTFRSPAVPLRSGQIANTDQSKTSLEFITEPVAVHHFSSRVVDEDGTDVPLSELYVHHWLIYNSTSSNGGVCGGLANIWGIGAELRGDNYTYPPPHAIVTTGEEKWTANLHFIRTTNTNVADRQDCIECRCPDSDPPLHPHGAVYCCKDRSQCYGMENATIMDTKNYYLEYTVGYLPITKDTVALTVYSFDVTSTTTTDCQIQYDVPLLQEGEDHTVTSTSIAPTDMNVTFVEVHQHIGGHTFSVEHYRGSQKLGDLCTAEPQYAVDGVDKGYLIAIPTCLFPEGPVVVKKGDGLVLTSVYTSRGLAGGVGYHQGVMGLVFIAAVAAPDLEAECMAELHFVCGTPVYPSNKYCLTCAAEEHKRLEAAHCTVEMVQKECSKNNDDGNIPAPDAVKGMHLEVRQQTPSTYLWNLTCPVASWCSVGINSLPEMANATAFVYSAHTGDASMQLSVRLLGYHEAGRVISPSIPIKSVSTIGDSVNIIFETESQAYMYNLAASISGPLSVGRTCVLFAQGPVGTATLGYHGATRGFSCL